jgi:DeoR family transcriptional regulator of aga operon
MERESRVTGVDGPEGRRGRLRRDQMLGLIRTRGFVSTAELAKTFEVSTVTARADVDRLAAQGRVRRVRGGVIVGDLPHTERPFELTRDEAAREKAAIAAAAAELIASGQTLILDVGSTTTAVAHALVARADLTNIVVITNGLTIATVLEPAIPRFTVILTGGTLRPMQHSLVDPLGGCVLERIQADLAFVGCNGVHPQAGVTNINLPEVEMKARAIGAARRCIVLADGTKVGQVALGRICLIEQIDLLVTGPSAPEETLEALRARGLEIHVVELASSSDQERPAELGA